MPQPSTGLNPNLNPDTLYGALSEPDDEEFAEQLRCAAVAQAANPGVGQNHGQVLKYNENHDERGRFASSEGEPSASSPNQPISDKLVHDLANRLKEPDGGFTVHPKGHEPKTGFAVANKTGGVVVRAKYANNPRMMRAAIKDFVSRFPAHDPNLHIGGWKVDKDYGDSGLKKGDVTLDQVHVIGDQATAEKMGRENNQAAIFNLGTFQTIDTGGNGNQPEEWKPPAQKMVWVRKGGPGSGNFGHEGRPGERGGSGSGGAAQDKNGNDLVDLKGNPVPVNSDGTLTLYHHTAPETADKIRGTGSFKSLMNTQEVYFTNKRNSEYAAGFGKGEVVAHIPANLVELNDAFPDGEVHVAVDKNLIKPSMIETSVAKGGPGSGNFGHEGRPGERGGSGSGGGIGTVAVNADGLRAGITLAADRPYTGTQNAKDMATDAHNVYEAEYYANPEDGAYGQKGSVPPLASQEEAQSLADKIMAKYGGDKPPTVEVSVTKPYALDNELDASGTAGATHGGEVPHSYEIELDPKYGMTQQVLIHELAHALNQDQGGNGHGKYFRETYALLLQNELPTYEKSFAQGWNLTEQKFDQALTKAARAQVANARINTAHGPMTCITLLQAPVKKDAMTTASLPEVTIDQGQKRKKRKVLKWVDLRDRTARNRNPSVTTRIDPAHYPEEVILKGGSGSGYFGHEGRPGERGGSAAVADAPGGFGVGVPKEVARRFGDQVEKVLTDAGHTGFKVRRSEGVGPLFSSRDGAIIADAQPPEKMAIVHHPDPAALDAMDYTLNTNGYHSVIREADPEIGLRPRLEVRKFGS